MPAEEWQSPDVTVILDVALHGYVRSPRETFWYETPAKPDKRPHETNQIWIERLSTASAASESVGWAWQVRARSSAEPPNSMSTQASAMSSPATVPVGFSDRLLEGGNAPAGNAEHRKKRIPKGFGFRVLRRFIGPFMGKFQGAVF